MKSIRKWYLRYVTATTSAQQKTPRFFVNMTYIHPVADQLYMNLDIYGT